MSEDSRKRQNQEKGPKGLGRGEDPGENEKKPKKGASSGSGASAGSAVPKEPASAAHGRVMESFVTGAEDDLASVTSDEESEVDIPMSELEIWAEARFGCRKIEEDDLSRLREDRAKTKQDLSRMVELSRRKTEIEDAMELTRDERSRLNQQTVEMVSLARHLYRQSRQQMKMAKLVRNEQLRTERGE